jgi:hypothetical protein
VVPAAALAALLVATGHAVYRMGGAGRASAQTNGAPHVAPGVEGVR